MDADSATATQPAIDLDSFDDGQFAYLDTQASLTPAMQAFAEHWAYNRNQIKAYQHAYPGSSINLAKNNAGRLFRDRRVQLEIRRVLERASDYSKTTIQQIEHQLSRIAFADARKLYDEHGNLRKPCDWDADTAAAVAAYSETPTRYGMVRKVRLHEPHGPARTLAEIKGAFDKHKAPPGVQASFTINLGGGPQALGGQPQTLTIDMDTTKKKAPKRQLSDTSKKQALTIGNKSMPRKAATVARSQAHRIKVERANAHDTSTESPPANPDLPVLPSTSKPELF